MSRNTKSWVVFALTSLFIPALTLLGSAPATAGQGDPIIPTSPSCVVTLVSGDPATAPAAPTCFDPSGADEDELLVPLVYSQVGYNVSYVNEDMNPYHTDRPNSTNGASQVSVQSMRYDPGQQMYVPGHAWVLYFNTAVTGPSSANTYWLSVGDCVETAGLEVRSVTAFVRNEPGDGGRYIGSFYPDASAPGVTVSDTATVTRVYDGATVGVPLIAGEFDPGLFTGYTYTVGFWIDDIGTAEASGSTTRVLGALQTVYVPPCDGSTSTPPPPLVATPMATITVVHWTRRYRDVSVALGSLRATKPTRYVVVIDPRRGRTIRRTFLTEHQVLSYHVRKRTLVKVYFSGRVVLRRV